MVDGRFEEVENEVDGSSMEVNERLQKGFDMQESEIRDVEVVFENRCGNR